MKSFTVKVVFLTALCIVLTGITNAQTKVVTLLQDALRMKHPENL